MTVRPFDVVFRDFVTDGVAASGVFHPEKKDIRDSLNALAAGPFPDNRVIKLNNANEGTPNEIIVSASVAIPTAAFQVLYILNVTQENTGPVTVSGAINRDLVTNINQPIAPGYLIPGMALLCIDTGTELRLLSYGDAEAILAAAEVAAARAEAAAAGLNLPSTETGDKGKALLVNSDASGYSLSFVEITVETRSDLKSVPVFFKAAYLFEAGREGNFVLKAGSPPVSDTQEGVYVVSDTSGYYWERVYVGAASAKWFGAKGDGTTNDSAAVQAALDVTKNVKLTYSSAGYVIGGVELADGMSISGQQGRYSGGEATVWGPAKTTVILPAGSNFAFRIANFAIGTYVKISTFRFQGAASTGTAIRMKTNSGIVYGVRLNDLSFVSCVEAIGDEGSTSNYVVDIEAHDISCVLTRGRQIYFKRSSGMVLFRGVKIDHTQNTGDVTWEGARFDNIAGLELERFDIIGYGSGAAYQATAFALVVTGAGAYAASVWLNRVLADTVKGPGIHIEGIYNVQGNFVSAGHVWGPGITLKSCTYIEMTNVFIVCAVSAPLILGLRLKY